MLTTNRCGRKRGGNARVVDNLWHRGGVLIRCDIASSKVSTIVLNSVSQWCIFWESLRIFWEAPDSLSDRKSWTHDSSTPGVAVLCCSSDAVARWKTDKSVVLRGIQRSPPNTTPHQSQGLLTHPLLRVGVEMALKKLRHFPAHVVFHVSDQDSNVLLSRSANRIGFHKFLSQRYYTGDNKEAVLLADVQVVGLMAVVPRSRGTRDPWNVSKSQRWKE